MDGKSFDRWTLTRAAATNRRSLLGLSITAGVASVLSRVLPASAQFDGAAAGSCTYDVTLTSSLNPGERVTGTLVIDIGQDGAIDNGSLTLQGQSAAPVVGQATGLAIDLLAALADGTTVSLTGVAPSPVSDCSGTILGSLANPTTSQIGTWEAVSGSGSGTGSGSSAPPITSGQSGSGSSNGSGSGSGSGSGQQPACLEDRSSCDDDAQCCSGFCTNGECRSCGGMMCGGNCIDPGLDPENCGGCGIVCDGDCNGGQCSDGDGGGGGCVDLGGGCDFDAQCCSGWCNAGMCASCTLSKVCDGQCVDIFSDNNHCGNCNNPCFSPQFCSGGACQG